MSQIIRLTDKNFNLVGKQKKTMILNIPGIVLVFFKTSSCLGCAAVEPKVIQISQEETRISYAFVNVGDFNNVVRMSKASTTEIKTVPALILYIDGTPYARYNGEKTVVNIKNFINRSLQQKLQNTQQPSFVQAPINTPYHQPQQQPPQPPAGYKAVGTAGGNQEEGEQFLIPPGLIPYNTPWESDYQNYN